jgi:uncharacterized protein RhaS with RHS repeats
MPALGRWGAVDPLADQSPGWSAYNYTLNNPAGMVDPDGRVPVPAIAFWTAARAIGGFLGRRVVKRAVQTAAAAAAVEVGAEAMGHVVATGSWTGFRPDWADVGTEALLSGATAPAEGARMLVRTGVDIGEGVTSGIIKNTTGETQPGWSWADGMVDALTAAGGNFIPTTSGPQEAVVDAVSTGTISGIRSRLSGGVTSELPAPAVDMPQDATRIHLPPPTNPEEDGRREHD